MPPQETTPNPTPDLAPIHPLPLGEQGNLDQRRVQLREALHQQDGTPHAPEMVERIAAAGALSDPGAHDAIKHEVATTAAYLENNGPETPEQTALKNVLDPPLDRLPNPSDREQQPAELFSVSDYLRFGRTPNPDVTLKVNKHIDNLVLLADSVGATEGHDQTAIQARLDALTQKLGPGQQYSMKERALAMQLQNALTDLEKPKELVRAEVEGLRETLTENPDHSRLVLFHAGVQETISSRADELQKSRVKGLETSQTALRDAKIDATRMDLLRHTTPGEAKTAADVAKAAAAVAAQRSSTEEQLDYATSTAEYAAFMQERDKRVGAATTLALRAEGRGIIQNIMAERHARRSETHAKTAERTVQVMGAVIGELSDVLDTGLSDETFAAHDRHTQGLHSQLMTEMEAFRADPSQEYGVHRSLTQAEMYVNYATEQIEALPKQSETRNDLIALRNYMLDSIYRGRYDQASVRIDDAAEKGGDHSGRYKVTRVDPGRHGILFEDGSNSVLYPDGSIARMGRFDIISDRHDAEGNLVVPEVVEAPPEPREPSRVVQAARSAGHAAISHTVAAASGVKNNVTEGVRSGFKSAREAGAQAARNVRNRNRNQP